MTKSQLGLEPVVANLGTIGEINPQRIIVIGEGNKRIRIMSRGIDKTANLLKPQLFSLVNEKLLNFNCMAPGDYLECEIPDADFLHEVKGQRLLCFVATRDWDIKFKDDPMLMCWFLIEGNGEKIILTNGVRPDSFDKIIGSKESILEYDSLNTVISHIWFFVGEENPNG